jgi:hypothetical protein
MKFNISIKTAYNYWYSYTVIAPSQVAALRIARKLAAQIIGVTRIYADPFLA